MDKILKFLKQLSKKKRERLLRLIESVLANEFKKKPKKLKGFKNLYRVRDGKIRVVFKRDDKKNTIINIDYRKDAYRDL